MKTKLPLLSILAGGEKCGREIREEYERRRGQRLSLAVMYVALGRMESGGLIESWMGESVPDRDGNRRRYFRITGLGERILKVTE